MNAKQIEYAANLDILNFWRGKPSHVSIDVEDFIIDLDRDGYVVGLEVLNASENLNLESKELKNIKDVAISVTYKPSYIHLTIHIRLEKGEKDISIPLVIDSRHKELKKEQFILSR